MDRLLNLLGAFTLRVADEVRRATEEAAGRSAAAPAALSALSRHRGQSMLYLQTALRLSQPATVRVVDRLTQDGYVRRTRGDDARTVRPVLTPDGEVAAARCRTARATVLQKRLDRLDVEQRASLLSLLELLLSEEPKDERDATNLCRLCDVEACAGSDGGCPVDAGLCGPHGRG